MDLVIFDFSEDVYTVLLVTTFFINNEVNDGMVLWLADF